MTRIVCNNTLFLRGVAPDLPKVLPGSDPNARLRAALQAVKALGVDPLDLLAYAVFDDARQEVDESGCCESTEAHIGHMFEDEAGGFEDEIQSKAKEIARADNAYLEHLSRA